MSDDTSPIDRTGSGGAPDAPPGGDAAPGSNGAGADGAHGDDAAADRLSELRDLLLGPERRDLTSLHRRVDDPESRAMDLAEVLPEALPAAIARREKPDKKLAAALGPTLEDAFRTSVRNNPKQLADAIAPVLGPAIRRSIADALQRMVQSISQTVDHSLSLRSVKWRWEARKTGRPFAEIVLINTLAYRVEHIFLIHRETGLLLQQVSLPAAKPLEGDMISGMLSAIRDFVRDSFGGGEDQTLEDFHVGGRSVWVEQEQGAKAVLAAVIWGNAPRDLRDKMCEALATVHLQQAADLENFAGDTDSFEQCRPVLEQCLVEASRAEPRTDNEEERGSARTRRRRRTWAAVAVVLLLAAGAAAWAYRSARAAREVRERLAEEQARWTALVSRLRAEPGIVVTEARPEGEGYVVAGLRDPLAGDPGPLADGAGIGRERVRWQFQHYASLEPAFAERRAKAALSPPGSVTLRLDGGTLRATGEAPGRWMRDARRLAPLMPGVGAYDDSGLANADLRRLGPVRDAIESKSFRFVKGSVAFKGLQDERVREVADLVAQLMLVSEDAGVSAKVELVGAGDTPAPGDKPAEAQAAAAALARQRADAVRSTLVRWGVPATSIAVPDPATAAGAEPGTVGLRVSLAEGMQRDGR